MTTTINGLLSVKPGNEPVEGETRSFLIEQRPAKGDKKAWIKIKHAGADFGGSPYRILSANPTGYTDQHGNISFNVEIEESQQSKPNGHPNPRMPRSDDEQDWPEAPPIAPEPPPKRFSALDERQRAIIRQHSQSMALEVLKLKVALDQLTVEDLTPSKLRALADYFDTDVYGATNGN